MIFGLDRHYYPIEIPSGSQIKIKTIVVSLTAGTYYTHNTVIGVYTSFWQHLITRLNTVYGGVWSVTPHTPAGYPFASGVRLTVTGASGTETIDFDGTSPLVKQILGYPSTQTGTTAFVGGNLDSPWSSLGSWTPWSMFEGRASTKDPIAQRVQEWSSDHPEVAKAITWRERRLRVWSYGLVYGAHCLRNRASQAILASQGRVAVGDDHNALERLWESAGRDLKAILVVPDQTSLSFELTPTYEVYKLASKASTTDLDSMLTRSNVASDIWEIKIPTVIVGGNYLL